MRRPVLLSSLLLALALVGAGRAQASVGAAQDVVSGLVAPWEVVAAPSGATWVVERGCRVTDVATRAVVRGPLAGRSCRKFLGMAVHPTKPEHVYLYETAVPAGASAAVSRVVRLRVAGATLEEDGTVLDGIRSDLSHDGGRLVFGPDGALYVTTGDVHDPATPQDVGSLNGKVLRLAAPGGPGDGAPLPDNPFVAQGGTAALVWSYGHRHPQGLAFDDLGRLWASEHGPTGEAHAPVGAEQGRDEVNLIVRGGNYGWPLVAGEQTRPGTIAPVAHAGATAWAPGDIAFAPDGRLYVPLLAGKRMLSWATTCDGIADPREHFADGVRLRAGVVHGGSLWFTTDGEHGNDRLRRAPLSSDGFTRACGSPAGGTGGTAATPSAAGPAPIAPAASAPGATVPPAPRATVVRRPKAAAVAVDRLTSALRRSGAAARLRRGAAVRTAAPSRFGRFTVRLTLLGSRSRLLVVARLRPARSLTVRLSRKARAGLSEGDRVRVTVRVTGIGRTTLRSRTVRLG